MRNTKKQYTESDGVLTFSNGLRLSREAYENSIRYKNEYSKKNYKQLLIRFNKVRDEKLINWIEAQDNATNYIVSLIRKDYIDSLVAQKKEEHIKEGLSGEELEKVLEADRAKIEEDNPTPVPLPRGRKLQSSTDKVKEAQERKERKDTASSDFENILSYISSLSLEEQEKILKRKLGKTE